MGAVSLVLHFDTPEALGAAIQNSEVRVFPDRAGVFRARLQMLRLPEVPMSSGRENLPRLIRGVADPDRVYFRLKGHAEPQSFLDGRVEEPGTTWLLPVDGPFPRRHGARASWHILSIRRETLSASADTMLVGAEASLRAAAGGAFLPDGGAFARLARLQSEVLALAARTPAMLGHPAPAASIDAQFLEATLALLESAAPQREITAARRGDAIMRRVDAYLEAYPAVPVTLAVLCQVAECSAKTLEVLFRTRLGAPPNRFLRARRLWFARRALLQADRLETTVTEVATACGFWELGRFAVAYRQLFGETPSQTLTRPPQESGAAVALAWHPEAWRGVGSG